MEAGAVDVFEGVAGDRDDWRRVVGCGVEAADLSWCQFVGGGGEVDAVGACGDRDVGAGVEEKLRWAVCHGDRLKHLAGESCNAGGGEIFFAKLDEVDAVGNPARGLTKQSGLLLKLSRPDTRCGW